MFMTIFQHLMVLLVYRRVSQIRVVWYWYLVLPLLFTALSVWLSPLYLLVYPPILIALSNLWDPNRSWHLHWFYGIYAIFFQGFVARFLGLGMTLLVPVEPAFLPWIWLLADFLVLPLNVLFLRLVNANFGTLRSIIDYSYLRQLLFPLNSLMFSGYWLWHGLVIWQEHTGQVNLVHQILLVASYLLVFLLLVFDVIRQMIAMAEQALLAQKDKQLQDLASYSKHVESLYKEIRSFRHDYANILISLKLGIDERDMDMVQKVYDGVLANTANKFQEAKYDIGRLMNITDDAIKSVLSAKLLEAQSEGLNIVLEVGEAIGKPNMDLLDFITVLTILCDNAIYEAKATEEAQLTIAYFQEAGAKILIVENSTRDEQINISKIFEEGYSTKGDNRGIGLANVRRIADSDMKVTIQTFSRNHIFRQTLKMID